MLLPQLIDRLNAINMELIRKIETQHLHVRQLEQLVATLGATVTDIHADKNLLFNFSVAVPAAWRNRHDELADLLADYGYTGLHTYSYATGMYYTCHRETLYSLAILIAAPVRAAA